MNPEIPFMFGSVGASRGMIGAGPAPDSRRKGTFVPSPLSRPAPSARRVVTGALAVMLAAAALTSGCNNDSEARPQGEESPGGRRGRGGEGGPVPVVTTKAVAKPMPIGLTTVGTVEAISTVEVRSQVTGRILQVHFAEGQDVEAGQLLFTLDPQPFQVALDQATAVLARDTAQAENAQAQVTRYKSLLDRGLLPREQYETQLAGAAALKATTDAGQAAVAAARLNLEYTRIVAPATGRTGALQVHEGDLVQANGAPPLVVTNQLAPIYVTFSVPGKDLESIRRFQRAGSLPVKAKVAGVDDAPTMSGQLSFIDNSVDAETGTIRLKGTFANGDHGLWPGQFVDVTLLLTTEPHAIVVPSVAVQAGQQGPYLFVVDSQSHVEMRPVTVARIEGDESVISSGLKAGEVVVTDGHLRLVPGVQVTSREPARAAASGAP